MNAKLLIVSLALCLVVLASSAWAMGTITMSSSGDATNGVTIDVTVTDPGGGPPGCNWLGVARGYGGPIVGVITRQPGTTTNHQVVDTAVQPNTIYCYRMVMLQFPVPVPLYCGNSETSLCQVFDCFCDISTCINTGPGPALIGHGYLNFVNAGDVTHVLNSCTDGSQIAEFCGASGTAAQYVDTGIAVDVFGEPAHCYAQCFFGVTATAASPKSCVVATAQQSWGAVKSLYRN